jgi:hypothetical protein
MTKAQAASTLGPVAPPRERMARNGPRRHLANGALAGLSPIEIDRRHIGGDDQAVGIKFACQQTAAQVLVDYGLDALQAEAIASLGDRDATASRCDDERPMFEQQADGTKTKHTQPLWRGDDTPECGLIRRDHPMLLGRSTLGLGLREDDGRIGLKVLVGHFDLA